MHARRGGSRLRGNEVMCCGNDVMCCGNDVMVVGMLSDAGRYVPAYAGMT